jgi:hypothetical protein
VPEVADGDAESPLIEFSDVAQAESSDATTRNRAPRKANRLLMATNLTLDLFDATRGVR